MSNTPTFVPGLVTLLLVFAVLALIIGVILFAVGGRKVRWIVGSIAMVFLLAVLGLAFLATFPVGRQVAVRHRDQRETVGAHRRAAETQRQAAELFESPVGEIEYVPPSAASVPVTGTADEPWTPAHELENQWDHV